MRQITIVLLCVCAQNTVVQHHEGRYAAKQLNQWFHWQQLCFRPIVHLALSEIFFTWTSGLNSHCATQIHNTCHYRDICDFDQLALMQRCLSSKALVEYKYKDWLFWTDKQHIFQLNRQVRAHWLLKRVHCKLQSLLQQSIILEFLLSDLLLTALLASKVLKQNHPTVLCGSHTLADLNKQLHWKDQT